MGASGSQGHSWLDSEFKRAEPGRPYFKTTRMSEEQNPLNFANFITSIHVRIVLILVAFVLNYQMLFLIQRKQMRCEMTLTRLCVYVCSPYEQHSLPAHPITAADLLRTHQCPSQYGNNPTHCSSENVSWSNSQRLGTAFFAFSKRFLLNTCLSSFLGSHRQVRWKLTFKYELKTQTFRLRYQVCHCKCWRYLSLCPRALIRACALVRAIHPHSPIPSSSSF